MLFQRICSAGRARFALSSRAGSGNKIEQIERAAAAGQGQVADDGAGDAAGRAGDEVDGLAAERQAGCPSAADSSISVMV